MTFLYLLFSLVCSVFMMHEYRKDNPDHDTTIFDVLFLLVLGVIPFVNLFFLLVLTIRRILDCNVLRIVVMKSKNDKMRRNRYR